jgi:hypothetical protein
MSGILKVLKLLSEITAAGYKLTETKAINREDGYCWTATLCFGKKKLVTVSNGGHGGPDEFKYYSTPSEGYKGILIDLSKLYSTEAIKEYCRDYHISMEKFSLDAKKITAEQFAAIKDKILNSEIVVDQDMLGSIVDEIRSAKEENAKLKRMFKTKTAWLKKGGEEGNEYVSIGFVDTPERRLSLQNKYPDIGIFLNDYVI